MDHGQLPKLRRVSIGGDFPAAVFQVQRNMPPDFPLRLLDVRKKREPARMQYDRFQRERAARC